MAARTAATAVALLGLGAAALAVPVGPAGPATAGSRYPANPPPAHTGGFGEPTCRECHFDSPLNDPGGRLTLEGVPVTYRPGRTYAISVALVRPGMERGGFQLSVRFGPGGRAGDQAGSLAAVDQAVGVVDAGEPAVQYAQHTEAGTFGSNPGDMSWTMMWTAPGHDEGENVVFHVSANAANDDASEFGDFIYTGSAASQREPVER